MIAAEPSPAANGQLTARDRAATLRRDLKLFLRSPYFWRVQAMVGLIVVPFYILEMSAEAAQNAVHLVVPLLYAIPILVSGLFFRYEGARLTALLAALLVLPNFVALITQQELHALTEVGEIILALLVGLVLARLLEREAAERRRVQDLSARLAEAHGRLTQAHEEERRNIARELHDVTAQNLILLSRGLDALAHKPTVARATGTALPELWNLAETVLADVRRLSRELRPSILDDLGLVAAARWFAGEVGRRSGLEVQVVIAGEERPLKPDTRLHLYRILQETLHNAEKHAKAKRITVTFSYADRSLGLTICDDGSGFELPRSLESLAAGGNLGLVGMHERARIVGANLQLQSEAGKGTCCLLVVDI